MCTSHTGDRVLYLCTERIPQHENRPRQMSLFYNRSYSRASDRLSPRSVVPMSVFLDVHLR
jgi:hypothetical protein